MAPDISLLKTISQQNLSTALRLIAGFKKILVIEAKLIQTLDLFANYQFLTNHGVAKVYHLENCNPPYSFDTNGTDNTVIYLIQSNLISAKLVCDQINYHSSHQQQQQSKHQQQQQQLAQPIKFGVLVIPKNLYIISSLFESEGVYGNVTIGQYSYEFIPLDDYIWSLEYDQLVPDLWLHRDTSYLSSIAKQLFNLRGIYGEFHHLIALGPASTSILKLITEFEYIHQQSLRDQASNRTASELPTVIIMDRSLDFLSPFLLPMTYEGLLDELFEIRGKSITFTNPAITSSASNKPVKHLLSTNSDAIFDQIRNTHFSSVVKQLVGVGTDLKRQKDGSTYLPIAAMKSFVERDLKKIQQLQKNVCLHLNILDFIIKEKATMLKQIMDIESNIFDNVGYKDIVKNYLEDSMAKNDIDHVTILRLFCVISLVQNGIKDYKILKQQFIQSYGFKYLIVFHQLEQLGLIYPWQGIDVASPTSVVQAFTRKGSMMASASSFTGNQSNVGAGGSGGIGNKQVGTNVPFQTVINKLVPPTNTEIKLDVPDHPSYIFNGKYTPLITKLTEEILSILFHPKSSTTTGTMIEKKIDDILKFYHITQNAIKLKSSSNSSNSSSSPISPSMPSGGGIDPYSRGRNIFVFIVGGITRSEISSLQLISRKLECNIIAGGTNITNGNKLLTSLVTA